MYIIDLIMRSSFVGECPPPRTAHTSAVSGRELIVFGGEGPVGVLGDTWSYSFDEASWSEIAPYVFDLQYICVFLVVCMGSYGVPFAFLVFAFEVGFVVSYWSSVTLP